MSTVTIDNVPEDCLLEIFSYLGAEDLAMSVRHVDARWMRISQRVCLWRHIAFTPAVTLTERDIAQHLQNMPNLRSFRLRHQKGVDMIMTALCNHCVDVRCVVTERKLGPSLTKVEELLKKFPNMERLDVTVPGSHFSMDYTKFYEKVNKSNDLTVFRNISFRSLSVRMCSFGHQYSNYMRPSPSLEEDIRRSLHERANDLKAVGLVCKLTSHILKSISYCKNLTYLFVDNESLDCIEIDFRPLGNLKLLNTFQLLCTRISMAKWNMSCESVEFLRLVKLEIVNSGEILQNSLSGLLSSCPELRYLNVQESLILDRDLESICHCKHLVHLDVSENLNLTDACMNHVARGCNRLQFLDISFCPFMTDNIFKILQGCRDLQAFHAVGNMFDTDRAHKLLALFPCLEDASLGPPIRRFKRTTTV